MGSQITQPSAEKPQSMGSYKEIDDILDNIADNDADYQDGGDNNLDLSWEDFVHTILTPSLRLSSKNARTEALNSLIFKCKRDQMSLSLLSEETSGDDKKKVNVVDRISKETLSIILQVLLNTVPRYNDSGRKMVLKAVISLVTLSRAESEQSVDNPATQVIVRLLEKELKATM